MILESGQGTGGGVSRVYTYCLQEVPGQVIGTVVTCNGVHCDNVTPGGGREDVGCGVGYNMGNIDNKVGAILISTKRFIVHSIRCFYRTWQMKIREKYFLLNVAQMLSKRILSLYSRKNVPLGVRFKVLL